MKLNLVSEHLLTQNTLTHQDLSRVLSQLSERQLDYGDLYFQSSMHESWGLEDNIIKEGSWHIDQGVGIRAISGEKRVLLMPINLPYRPLSRVRRRHVVLSKNKAMGEYAP